MPTDLLSGLLPLETGGFLPALSKDENTVYVGSWDNYLYAVNSMNGSLDWSFETSSYVTSSPAVDLDGRIYFGSDGLAFLRRGK